VSKETLSAEHLRYEFYRRNRKANSSAQFCFDDKRIKLPGDLAYFFALGFKRGKIISAVSCMTAGHGASFYSMGDWVDARTFRRRHNRTRHLSFPIVGGIQAETGQKLR